MKSRSCGLRLPLKLYELIMSHETNLDFNTKVVRALKIVYDPSDSLEATSEPDPDYVVDGDIESRVDELTSTQDVDDIDFSIPDDEDVDGGV